MQRKWKRMWARDYSLFYSASFMSVFTTRPNFDCARNKLFIPEGGLYAIYFDEKELNTLIRNYTEMLLNTDLQSFAQWYEKQFAEFLDWSRSVIPNDPSSLSDDAVTEVLKSFLVKLLPFVELQFDSFLVLDGAARQVEDALTNNPTILQAITTPYKHTKITNARIELLEVISNGTVSDEALKKYLEKYDWIPVSDFTHSPMTLAELKAQVAGIADARGELEAIAREQGKGLQTYENYLKSISDTHFKKLVEITHHFAYLKEMRDDYRRPAYVLWRTFLIDVGERINLTLEQVGCLTPEELLDAFTNHTDYSSAIAKRCDTYALWFDDGVLRVYSGYETNQVIALVQLDSQEDVVKGFSASKGIVTGPARVIFHRGEFGKFQNGDVLVTTMTHPEFLPLMKQAKAIVTDEGGITSHAAITARELGIPCIIGTKIATKAFKDGDIVEVDAEKGVVRII